MRCSRRVATPETGEFNRRCATRTGNNLIPALKRRAKFIPTLRVESTCSELSQGHNAALIRSSAAPPCKIAFIALTKSGNATSGSSISGCQYFSHSKLT